jgi:hypothetical protein
MQAIKTRDPWCSAVAALMRLTYASADIEATPSITSVTGARGSTRQPLVPRPSLTVRIVERLTHCTVSVCWHDATACRYDDQIWRLGVARRSGVCALTSRSIQTGEAVYRPINTSCIPLNHGAMILASCIDDHTPDDDPGFNEVNCEDELEALPLVVQTA